MSNRADHPYERRLGANTRPRYCSTVDSVDRRTLDWNRTSDPQARNLALSPLSYEGRYAAVGSGGVTDGCRARCLPVHRRALSPLSYSHHEHIGLPRRDRTADLHRVMVALSQTELPEVVHCAPLAGLEPAPPGSVIQCSIH